MTAYSVQVKQAVLGGGNGSRADAREVSPICGRETTSSLPFIVRVINK